MIWLLYIFRGHPSLWALSFGEDVGGKSSVRRSALTSVGMHIKQCVHIVSYVLCKIHYLWHKKSVESSCCLFHESRLLHCQIQLNRQRQSPRRYENRIRKETYIIHLIASERVQSMLTRSPRDWYNHTRDIYRWPYSRLWYWLFWKISVCLKHSVDKRLPLCLDCLPTQSPLSYRYVMVDFTTLSTA